MPATATSLPATARAWCRRTFPGSGSSLLTTDTDGATVTASTYRYSSRVAELAVAVMRTGAQACHTTYAPNVLAAFDMIAADPTAYTGAPADVRHLPDMTATMRAARAENRAFGTTWWQIGGDLLYTDTYCAARVIAPEPWIAEVEYPGAADRAVRQSGSMRAALVNVPAAMRRDLCIGSVPAGTFPGVHVEIAVAYSERADMVALAVLEADTCRRAIGTVHGIMHDRNVVGQNVTPWADLQMTADAARGIGCTVIEGFGGMSPVYVNAAKLNALAFAHGQVAANAGPLRPVYMVGPGGAALLMPVRPPK